MLEKRGNGYIGKSESVNSKNAKLSGEYPISYWTKSHFIEMLSYEGADHLIDKAQSLPLYILKKCLVYSGWHHTSLYFNITEFYSLDIDKLASLSVEEIKAAKNAHKQELALSTKKDDERKAIKRARKDLETRLYYVLDFTHYKNLNMLIKAYDQGRIDLEALEEFRIEARAKKRIQLEKQWNKSFADDQFSDPRNVKAPKSLYFKGSK